MLGTVACYFFSVFTDEEQHLVKIYIFFNIINLYYHLRSIHFLIRSIYFFQKKKKEEKNYWAQTFETVVYVVTKDFYLK